MRRMIRRLPSPAALTTTVAILLVAGCAHIFERPFHDVPDELVPVFQAAASAYGVFTAAQLAAQARVESGFDPLAVSHAGARGMMQFLPSTWAQFGVDGNKDGRADPLDPLDAIPSAANYDAHLAQALADLPGDRVTLILAAYNAGPVAVRNAGGVPDFDETRAYVARVHDWAATYQDQL